MQKKGRPQPQRNVSAKVIRHDAAIEKYRNYEANKINDLKLNDMISGEKHTDYVNKPGQYMVVTTGKDTAKGAHLDIPLMSLLDGTKTFSELKQNKQQKSHKKLSSLPSAKSFKMRPQTAKFSQMSQQLDNDNFIQIDEDDDSFQQREVDDKEYMEHMLKDKESKSVLTRDLKTVLRKQHVSLLSPSSSIIKDVVQQNVIEDGTPYKKVESLMQRVKSAKIQPLQKINLASLPQSAKSQNQNRPISAQFMINTLKSEKVGQIEQSKTFKNALQYDQKTFEKNSKKKKTSYIVQKNSQTASHIMGYNTIQLQPQDVRESEIQYLEQKKNLKEKNKKKAHERLKSAIDYSKQSPFIEGDEEAEKHIAERLGLPTGPQEVKQVNEEKQGFFLPLDYYNLDENDLHPQKTLEQYRDSNGEVWGVSKWFGNHGDYVWKPCQVLCWLQNEQRFEIRWETGKTKKVSRVNLRFKDEREDQFQKKLEAAEYYREMSEVYLKYNYMIDSMLSKTSEITQESLERIYLFVANFPFKLGKLRNIHEFHAMPNSIKYNSKRYIFPRVIMSQGKNPKQIYEQKKYNKQLVEQINKEIQQCFIRANRQIEFHNSLPFHEEKQKLFKGMLPDELFMTVREQRDAKQLPYKALINVNYKEGRSKSDFVKLVKKMNDIIHVGKPDRLQIFQVLHKNLQQYKTVSFFLKNFKHQFNFPEFKKKMDLLYTDRVRELKSQLLDTNFEVMDIIELYIIQIRKQNEEMIRTVVTEDQKKKLDEMVLSDDIIASMTKFQKVLNMFYERTARESFEFSINCFIEYFTPVLESFRKSSGLEQDFVINLECPYEYVINYQFEIQKGSTIYRLGDFQALLKLEITETIEDADKKISHVNVEPPIDTWRNYLQSIFPVVVDMLKAMPCLKSSNIGAARKNELLDIFEGDSDPLLVSLNKRLSSTLHQVFSIVDLFWKKLQSEFQFLVDQTTDSLKKLNKKINSFKEFEEEIQKVKRAKEQLQLVLFDDEMTLGIFQINVGEYRQFIEKQINKACDSIYKNLIQKIKKENEKIQKETHKIEQKLDEEPQNIEQLDALRYYCKITLEEELYAIKEKIDETMEKLNLFEVMWVKISEGDFDETWRIYGLPLEIRIKRDETLQRIKKQEEIFSSSLTQDQSDILLDIKELNYELDLLTKEKSIQEFKSIYDKFANLGDQIDKCLEDADVINRRERILKWKETDYIEVKKIKKKWNPYNSTWKYANDFHFEIIVNALESPISNIDREHITKFILDAYQDLGKLEKVEFKQLPDMKFVTQQIRKKYEEFKVNLPLINDLRNPHLKNAHWQKINKTIENYNREQEEEEKKILDQSPGQEGQDLSIDEDQSISLKTLLDCGILQIKEEIRDISEIARKEKDIERQLAKMRNDWKPIKLELATYKDTGTFVLKSIDPIMDKLDEDISKTLSIASSPYIKFLERDVMQWRDNLFKLQDTIEAWLKVQKMWTYLQPIFYSEDIIREMQKEGNKYSYVDKLWRQIMMNAQIQPTVMEACFQPRQRETFYMMIESLEQVIKGLNEYLNKKRAAFPRFYFLSNDELLQILAQTREPRAVQRHLIKCFEGIDNLTFQNDMMVTHMSSSEGEIIQLSNSVNPLDKEKNPRGVEEWLMEIEGSMKDTLKDKLKLTLEQSQKMKRPEWIQEHPSQMVITSDQALWTSGVTEALEKISKDYDALKKYYQSQENMLQEIVEMVRGDIAKIHRITLGVLVVIEVHQKDVVQELIDLRVDNIFSFDWLAQMRYYQEQKGMKVKMVNTQRDYGYEYLGNQGRLVITPLTDRCFRTLMSALQQNLGGAPEGPAGTGKTETTKDLAKAIAKHCVVFNCSDQLDYKAMGKFFKGLCSCGSWACFDEFNRIELEVLSVVAQQIWKIQNAILKQSLQKHPSKEFDFEDDVIKLDPTCAVFITMNPGYQGRSELPDNLKALFRPVAMMIPNYAMITEISLYSYGFTNARDLSVKITTSLRLASEQLSTQSHYDFGMRAIKAIITAAGNLKREYPDEEEAYLCLRAIGDCNLPKFTSEDVPLFQAIISDLFPEMKQKQDNYGELEIAIRRISKDNNLVLKERFYKKIIELYETIKVRHGLMVVGETNSGKSTIITTLKKSVERLNIKSSMLQLGLVDLEEIQQEEQESGNSDESDSEDEKIPSNNLENFLSQGTKQQQQIISQQNLQTEEEKQMHKNPLIRKQSIYENYERIKKLEYKKVELLKLNPKSITTKMLFGDFDEAGEWHNGITANIFRDCQEKKQDGNMNWVIFDGPVDALWIENMNTVLDDNKKLCLTNGETIKLVDDMNIIFEVEDLLEASPATVSRCGMVYLEGKDLGWRVFFEPWFNQLFEDMKTKYHKRVYNYLVEEFVEPCMDYVFSDEVKQAMPMTKSWMANNFFKVFESFCLKGLSKKQKKEIAQQQKEKLEAKIKEAKLQGNDIRDIYKKQKIQDLKDKEKGEVTLLMVQSLVWSFGAALQEQSRKQFHSYVLKRLQAFQKENSTWISTGQIPSIDHNIYDIYYDAEKKIWNPWKAGQYTIPKTVSEFNQIFVPTIDSVRHHHLLKILTLNEYPCLFSGQTGTGKTLIMKKFLLQDLEALPYRTTTTSFSANTTCSQVQDVLESKLEKTKRRRGVYGPVIGYTNIIFIDDINMPNKERYGAQPPLELIRQWFSQGGWYDRKLLEFNQIVDITFTACMGYGRPALSNRLLRNFNLIHLNDMADHTLSEIVEIIFHWGFEDFTKSVKDLILNLTQLSTSVHKRVSLDFLPLPSKSHYLFNLRDLMKVVQGVLSVPSELYPATMEDFICKQKVTRLWYHESLCVYSDRLVSDDDKKKFKNVIEDALNEKLNMSIENLVEIKKGDGEIYQSTMIYSNFMDNGDYSEVDDISKLKERVVEAIEQYNKQPNKKKIDIVLFEDALRMLCKISRIISSPFGHALMIGIGGSGSHTLTRLATDIQEYILFEIDLDADFGANDWLEFIRGMLRDIVMKDAEGGVFLISEGQLISEKFLEDINNLLNIGEIPNLYPQEDKENMLQDIKDKHKLNNVNGINALWEYFVAKCKKNLHICSCLSPIGDKLRNRIRNFPSLISCTSPIWVQPWSEEALKEVACFTLDLEKEEMQLEDDTINKISDIYLTFHTSVQNITHDYLKETGKHYYVTPISYLKLLSNFKDIYQSKLDQLVTQRTTYINGVSKLDECSNIIENMKQEIEMMQPKLVQKTQETEIIMKQVEKENIEAEKQKEIVQADEIDTAQKQEVASKIQEECKRELGVAEPKLQEAIAALKTLKISEIVEMKALQKPPSLIRLTFDAVCIMLNQKGKKGEKGQIEYWDDARKLLQDPQKFLNRLANYDKDNIPEQIIKKMEIFINKNKNTFTPQNIKKASIACEGICKWCHAIYEYYWVYQTILPLRKDLSEANEKLDQATKILQKKRDELSAIEKKCQDLREQFEDANLNKQKLNAQIQECQLKLDRAQQLTRNLANEQVRWKESSITLGVEIKNLLGDILLAVGSLSYLGAFTGEYRQRLIKNTWIPSILSKDIICSEDFSLVQRLGVPLEIQEWELQGLPLDEVSKENAIIMKSSDNWPLIIDPQNQAKKWIKKKETKKDSGNFVMIKPGKNLDKQLELAVRDGKSLLVDSCQEVLPPVLDQVLIKNNIQMVAGKKVVQLGIGPIEYNEDFRLYLISNMPNPHYTPDILTKVTLLNFTITQEAAKDQMLSILSREEDEQLENEKIRLMFENADNKSKMAMVEKNILKMLATTEPAAMLEDDNLIIELQDSKKISEEVEQRMREAKGTEERIKQMRINYSDVADLSSQLYFNIISLEKLDPMYQFSLEFFVRIFRKSIKLAEKVSKTKIEQRVKNLKESLKKWIYFEMQRSLFVKHKLLYSMMMTLTILKCQNEFNQELYDFMLSGLSGKPLETIENPDPDYFSDKQWSNILHLNNLQVFETLAYSVVPNLDLWKEFFDDICNPEKEMPEPFTQMSNLGKLVLTKAIRPELFVDQVKQFVQAECGPYFIENLIISLETSFDESEPQTPLIFLLTPGDDPQEELKKFAQEKGKYITFQSLGKGQGEAAEREIKESMQAGQWIMLQNCHLAVSWLPKLEEIMEEVAGKVQKNDLRDKSLNNEFRIWLTSMSSEDFPMQLLQQGIKMTKDPPKGVKANVLQLYHNQNSTKEDIKYFESCSRPEEWRKLFMSLTFFHAIIRERRRYGPIGWNIYYDFNQSDFRISRSQLKEMLEDYEEIPFKALKYLTGECYYGGKVTDDWDRRVIKAILSGFYNLNALNDNYKFSQVEQYQIPNIEEMQTLDMGIEYLNQLQDLQDPELFGLHQNAIISSATFECNFMVQSIIEIGSSANSQNSDKNQMIIQRTEEMLLTLPDNFNIAEAREQFQINYYESMNTVLIQEILRYNTLLNMLRSSLNDLLLALGGFKVMTANLENVIEGLLNNSIPQVWAQKSYPSLKSLIGYLQDLNLRVDMFKQWIDSKKPPSVFWLPGFYFTQSFFTGVRQNHARKNKIPIDQISFDFKIRDEAQDFDSPPDQGCYINGLYIEGARWCYSKHQVEESYPNVIFESMPIIQFVPIVEKKTSMKGIYEVPVYKTTERKGTLSTTGHSTNFILSIYLPTDRDVDHWVKRGVALLAALND